MELELSVAERLNLMGLLPQEGNYVSLKLIRIAREDLSFSDEEQANLKFVQDGKSIVWNIEKEVPKKVAFGEVVTTIIQTALKKLNDEAKLKDSHFTLYEKFCG